MPFREAFGIAVASLRANKLRSFLTVLGILIGVSSVIAVVAITEGLDDYIASRVLELGSRSFSVQRLPDIITSRDEFIRLTKRKHITIEDWRAVREGCTACSEVGAILNNGRDVKYGRTVQNGVQIMGITENMSRIGTVRELTAGRHLIEDDIDKGRPVAVIGQDLVDAFFGSGLEPLGKELMIGGVYPVRVVGVAEKKGTVFGNSQDNFVWIPISHYRKMFGNRQSVVIQAEARSMEEFEAAQDEARIIMRIRRHLDAKDDDDFNVETGESVMELWQSATRGIYFVTIVVTGISLVVGGVVVMNIMLVSVTERIREIGVRKALGARRRDILRQFLVESVILSVFGGILGIVGAAVFSWGLATVLGQIMSTQFTAPLRLWAILLAVFVSTLVGLVAGIYPAGRAAALDPVTALRNE
jgi:putative ABC transport system permease protein